MNKDALEIQTGKQSQDLSNNKKIIGYWQSRIPFSETVAVIYTDRIC